MSPTDECRIAHWDEALLAEEWRDSISPHESFRGWGSLDKIAERVDAFVPEGPRLAHNRLRQKHRNKSRYRKPRA